MLIFGIWGQVWTILPRGRRRQLFALWSLLTLSSLGQLAGIVCWYPFIKVLMDQGAIRTTPWLGEAYEVLGFETPRSFVVFLGMALGLAVLLSTGLQLVSDWLSCRYSWSVRLDLGQTVLRHLVHRPHRWLMERNSAHMARAVLEGVPWIVDGCILAMCRVYTALVLSLVVIAAIVWLDPWVALTSALVVGLVYALVYRGAKQRSEEVAGQRITESEAVSRCVVEALCSVKEARSPPFRRDPGASYRTHQGRLNELYMAQELLATIPGPLTEATIQIGVLFVGLYLLLSGEKDILAIMTVYIVALARIAPEAGAIYTGLTELRIHKPVLDQLYPRLTAPEPEAVAPDARLPLTRSLRLEDVRFAYEAGGPWVLREVSLEVPRLTSIALVGESGVGKTTLADIMAGVLVPDSGAVLVDDLELEGARRDAWRATIGYVPQQVYLSDDTVRRNIAFGVASDRIDEEQVRRAAALAHIDTFIEGLEAGYETVLGERGAAVSGGQLQRIGIARALYRSPEVLILDEATSALDTITEQSIMKTLASLARRQTVIVIAHRLSTVVGCDRICFLQGGRVAGFGTYQELLAGCPPFRALVEAVDGDVITPVGGPPSTESCGTAG